MVASPVRRITTLQHSGGEPISILSIRRLLPLSVVVLLVGFVPLLLLGREEEGGRYALLIGVNSYKKDQFRPLKYTENDIDALHEVFTGAGFKHVVRMTHGASKDNPDHLPTAKNIREELKSLLKRRGEQDTVVIAFSGHGVQFKDGGHFFCPMDADLTDRDTLISLKDVYDDLKTCNAHVKLLLVDACRNDPLAEGSTRLGGAGQGEAGEQDTAAEGGGARRRGGAVQLLRRGGVL